MRGNTPVERHKVMLTCDATAVKLGTPEGAFEIEYINAQPTTLAALPLGGKQLVFAGVISGSGARYAAGRFIWWHAGNRGISLSAPSGNGEERGTCRAVSGK
ncbi:MAG: MliC family protein [Bryobacteraceae bacterium]